MALDPLASHLPYLRCWPKSLGALRGEQQGSAGATMVSNGALSWM